MHRDGFQSPEISFSLEEKEGQSSSSWREGGKRLGAAAVHSSCPSGGGTWVPPPSLLLAPVMWEGAGYQLSWMQDAAPPAFSSILGDIPRNDSEECLPSKPGKFKNGGNFRVSYQLPKQPPLQETTLRSERFLRLSWQIKGLRETCACLKGVGAGGRTGNSSCSGQGCSVHHPAKPRSAVFQAQRKVNGVECI